MERIQITTIRETTNIQVIRLTAATVAKIVRARLTAQVINDNLDDPSMTEFLKDDFVIVGQLVEELYQAILPDEDDPGVPQEKTADTDAAASPQVF